MWTASKGEMAGVTGEVSRIVRRKVIDKTGLTGLFNIRVELPPDPLNPTGPSIFTVLEEQLGLKLESSKGLADVLAIDNIGTAIGELAYKSCIRACSHEMPD